MHTYALTLNNFGRMSHDMSGCSYCDKNFSNKKQKLEHELDEHGEEMSSHDKSDKKNKLNKLEQKTNTKNHNHKQKIKYSLAGVVGLMVLGLVAPQLFSGNSGSQQADFNLDKQPMLGNPNASVTVVEFGDYQCPYCQTFDQKIFPKLKENYIDTGKVKFYFVNMAFLGEDSTEAAGAAECVYKQDRQAFWDFHHALYDNQGKEHSGWVTTEKMMQIARQSTEGLDYDQLRQCISNQETLDEVKADKRQARQNGVTGTPTVFVNGEQVKDWSYQRLKAAIEKELSQSQRRRPN